MAERASAVLTITDVGVDSFMTTTTSTSTAATEKRLRGGATRGKAFKRDQASTVDGTSSIEKKKKKSLIDFFAGLESGRRKVNPSLKQLLTRCTLK